MRSFVDSVSEDIGLNVEMRQAIADNIQVREVAKGQMLARKMETSGKVYFVKSGCLRSYAIDDKGKEHIFMFAPEGWIISEINDLSNLFIDAIEDTTIEILDKHIFETLGNPQGMNTVGISKLLKRISVLQKRIILLMSASAQERYEDFISTYPEIVQRVPQKMIASYLGITPEALSKIRGSIARAK